MTLKKDPIIGCLLSLLCLVLTAGICALFMNPMTEICAKGIEAVLPVIFPDLAQSDWWQHLAPVVLPQVGPFLLTAAVVTAECFVFRRRTAYGIFTALASCALAAWLPFQNPMPRTGAWVGGAGCLLLAMLWKWASAKFPSVRNGESIRYVIFGILTTVVSFLSQMLFSNICRWPVAASTAGSWVCAVLFAYAVNKLFVFKSHISGVAALFREMGLFFGARVVSLMVEVAFMTVTVDWLHWSEALCKIAVQVIILVLNYLFSKRIIFKKHQKEPPEQ